MGREQRKYMLNAPTAWRITLQSDARLKVLRMHVQSHAAGKLLSGDVVEWGLEAYILKVLTTWQVTLQNASNSQDFNSNFDSLNR